MPEPDPLNPFPAEPTQHEVRIVQGDSVRFNADTLANRFPRADATVNINSPMYAESVDKDTDMVTCTRQGVKVGEFHAGELVKVDPDTGKPPEEPPPPDTIEGGGGEDTTTGGGTP